MGDDLNFGKLIKKLGKFGKKYGFHILPTQLKIIHQRNAKFKNKIKLEELKKKKKKEDNHALLKKKKKKRNAEVVLIV